MTDQQRAIHLVRIHGLGAVKVVGIQPSALIACAEAFKSAGYRLATETEFRSVRRRIETAEGEEAGK